MSLKVFEKNILNMKNQYSKGCQYRENPFRLAFNEITNTGFMGSSVVIFLTSKKSMMHEAPGCVAAPLVNMVAVNTITLGMEGQGTQLAPVRLYAPLGLSITTKHLKVGNIKLLVEPIMATLSCKKLSLYQTTDEEPEVFEIVKSWSIDDDMEVEKKSCY